jgi:hypothetical protein
VLLNSVAGGAIKATLETDRAERCIAICDANAEFDVVTGAA